MDFPWETTLATLLGAVPTVGVAAAAIWRFILRDIGRGVVQLRNDVVDLQQNMVQLRQAEWQEHRDVWGEHRSLYELRITATHEALARERDGSRQTELANAYRRAQDEYLNLLDRAVKFPDIIDPSLRNIPEYVDFLRGRLDEKTPSGKVSEAGEITSEERTDLRELLAKLERLAPATAEATFQDHLTRGNAYFRAADYEQALADYARALQLRPDHPGILMNRGLALHNLGRHEEALAAYDRALQLRPDHPDPDTLTNRGIALGNLRRSEEALAAYDRALQLRPDHPATLYNRACLFSLWNKPPEAVEDLRRAIAGDPKYRGMARTDSDFDNIRSDPRFQELVGEEERPPEEGASR